MIKQNYYSEPSNISSQDSAFYEVDIEKIKNADDLKTTVMVKNIPNKYN